MFFKSAYLQDKNHINGYCSAHVYFERKKNIFFETVKLMPR